MDELLKGIASGAGVAGLVLVYHLLVFEKRMRKVEEAIDRANRTDLLRLIASPHVASEIKENAATIMKEIDTAETERKSMV